jgi:hypothetical protein
MKKSGDEIFDAAYKATGHDKKKSAEIVDFVEKINELGGFNYKLRE